MANGNLLIENFNTGKPIEKSVGKVLHPNYDRHRPAKFRAGDGGAGWATALDCRIPQSVSSL